MISKIKRLSKRANENEYYIWPVIIFGVIGWAVFL